MSDKDTAFEACNTLQTLFQQYESVFSDEAKDECVYSSSGVSVEVVGELCASQKDYLNRVRQATTDICTYVIQQDYSCLLNVPDALVCGEYEETELAEDDLRGRKDELWFIIQILRPLRNILAKGQRVQDVVCGVCEDDGVFVWLAGVCERVCNPHRHTNAYERLFITTLLHILCNVCVDNEAAKNVVLRCVVLGGVSVFPYTDTHTHTSTWLSSLLLHADDDTYALTAQLLLSLVSVSSVADVSDAGDYQWLDMSTLHTHTHTHPARVHLGRAGLLFRDSELSQWLTCVLASRDVLKETGYNPTRRHKSTLNPIHTLATSTTTTTTTTTIDASVSEYNRLLEASQFSMTRTKTVVLTRRVLYLLQVLLRVGMRGDVSDDQINDVVTSVENDADVLAGLYAYEHDTHTHSDTGYRRVCLHEGVDVLVSVSDASDVKVWCDDTDCEAMGMEETHSHSRQHHIHHTLRRHMGLINNEEDDDDATTTITRVCSVEDWDSRCTPTPPPDTCLSFSRLSLDTLPHGPRVSDVLHGVYVCTYDAYSHHVLDVANTHVLFRVDHDGISLLSTDATSAQCGHHAVLRELCLSSVPTTDHSCPSCVTLHTPRSIASPLWFLPRDHSSHESDAPNYTGLSCGLSPADALLLKVALMIDPHALSSMWTLVLRVVNDTLLRANHDNASAVLLARLGRSMVSTWTAVMLALDESVCALAQTQQHDSSSQSSLWTYTRARLAQHHATTTTNAPSTTTLHSLLPPTVSALLANIGVAVDIGSRWWWCSQSQLTHTPRFSAVPSSNDKETETETETTQTNMGPVSTADCSAYSLSPLHFALSLTHAVATVTTLLAEGEDYFDQVTPSTHTLTHTLPRTDSSVWGRLVNPDWSTYGDVEGDSVSGGDALDTALHCMTGVLHCVDPALFHTQKYVYTHNNHETHVITIDPAYLDCSDASTPVQLSTSTRHTPSPLTLALPVLVPFQQATTVLQQSFNSEYFVTSNQWLPVLLYGTCFNQDAFDSMLAQVASKSNSNNSNNPTDTTNVARVPLSLPTTSSLFMTYLAALLHTCVCVDVKEETGDGMQSIIEESGLINTDMNNVTAPPPVSVSDEAWKKHDDIVHSPTDMKVDLVRVFTNVSHLSDASGLAVMGCLGVVELALLNSVLDPHNKYIREWSILCVRNLTHHVFSNQLRIQALSLQGVKRNQELERLGIEAWQEGDKIKIKSQKQPPQSQGAPPQASGVDAGFNDYDGSFDGLCLRGTTEYSRNKDKINHVRKAIDEEEEEDVVGLKFRSGYEGVDGVEVRSETLDPTEAFDDSINTNSVSSSTERRNQLSPDQGVLTATQAEVQDLLQTMQDSNANIHTAFM